MKNFFVLLILSMLQLGCEVRLNSDVPVYYEETVIEYEYDHCEYDPLPHDASSMQICASYPDAECCMWTLQHSQDWICDYTWCFYWDICEWEYIQSGCW